jgi:uncharacterized protein YabE (DUF348 family)
VRPSPAREEAPEPDVWLPILDISGELEALDITAELEALDLDAHRAEFDATLETLQHRFWSSAPLGLEEAIARVTTAEPVVAEPVPVAPVAAAPAIEVAAPAPPPAPAPVAEPLGLGQRIRLAVHGIDARTRLVGTLLVVALIAALASVAPSVVGASVPQRYVTLTLDGHSVSRTVRVESVAEVLALESITVHPDDRVIPAPTTALREGMHIQVLRSFPVDVDVDGTVTTVRTTERSVDALRRTLGIGSALVAEGADRLTAGSAIAFRTPHDVTLRVDGHDIAAPHSTALDVAALLAQSGVALGARDEVLPAPSTRLVDGLSVQVFRLADNQIAERVAVPFTTETRDDPNLQVGQTRTIQEGTAGVRRDLFQVTTRDDGVMVDKTRIGSELLVPPVSKVVVKGTQPRPAQAVGTASWYGTGPGRYTCAHLSLPFGTVVTITNTDTGATAQCRVQDRGPEAWTGHIIDLAPEVFRQLAPLSQGIAPVALSYSQG